jgi:hypothetical protein
MGLVVNAEKENIEEENVNSENIEKSYIDISFIIIMKDKNFIRLYKERLKKEMLTGVIVSFILCVLQIRFLNTPTAGLNKCYAW